jgi:VIT1/CCC1 family predicted Fe2+/Mn2+ transporter
VSQHARDELGIDMDDLANPLQASLASAVAFTVGAAIPLLSGAFILDTQTRNLVVLVASTLGLLVLGATGAALGGARQLVGALRVLVGGLLAMAVTYGIGCAFAQLSDGGHL